ncbi:unnamed protein product [Diamesa serratosioi]
MKILVGILLMGAAVLVSGNPLKLHYTESEEVEILCTHNISSQFIYPQMMDLLEKLRNNEFEKLRDVDLDYKNYQKLCKKVQFKVLNFQMKMNEDLKPCLRETTKKEYEAYMTISHNLSNFLCQLSETQFEIFYNQENSKIIFINADPLAKCLKGAYNKSTEDDQEFYNNSFDKVCSIDSTKFLSCTKDILIDLQSEKSQVIIEMLWNFLTSQYQCDSNEIQPNGVDRKYITGYYNIFLQFSHFY